MPKCRTPAVRPDTDAARGRRLRVLAVLILALLLVCGCARQAGPDLADTPRAARITGGEASAAVRDATSGQPPELGVQIFALWRDWPMHEELLDRIAASGAQWIRVDVGWCSLEEAGPGQLSDWYLDRLDATITAARRRGLHVLASLGCTPAWAGARDFDQFPPADALDDYERIARWLSARYRSEVGAWEIWNEPDCVGGCHHGSPHRYAEVLQAGYRGVRDGDSTALVVTGGTSGVNLDFLRQMYAAGGKSHFDVIGVHPYLDPTTAGPTEGHSPYRFADLALLHGWLESVGEADTPVWLTEWGWSRGGREGAPGLTDEEQSAYLRESVWLIQNEYPYVRVAVWFTIRDRDDWTSYENGFGLLRLDGTPRPAYWALSESTAALGTG